MAGFVIDIYTGFIVRWIILYWRRAVSRSRPTVAGAVVRCHFEKSGYGGDYVVLSYKYKVDGERFHGVMKKPYIYDNYAKAYTRHLAANSNLKVRVNPKDPARSFPLVA